MKHRPAEHRLFPGFFHIAALLAFCCTTAVATEIPPWLPEPQPVKRADVITVSEIPGGPAQHGRAAGELRSLNGEWKISPLETAPEPFDSDAPEDLKMAAPGVDDSNWDRIAVPLDWFRKYPKARVAGHPYVRGTYRTTFNLTPADLTGRRVILKFDVVGYDARVFLNGVEVGRHRGDFTPFEIDATSAAKTGENVLAVRVIADRGPAGGRRIVDHAYGAQWAPGGSKGGIWQNVSLALEPEVRIRRLLINSRLESDSIEVDYTILNHIGKPLQATLAVRVTPAIRADAGKTTGENTFPVQLLPGENRGSFTLKLNQPRRWSPGNPYLYFLTADVKKENEILCSTAERFGFRDFRAADGGFYLNGEKIYLFGQNLSSVQYGGRGLSDAEEAEKLADQIARQRSLGYVISRTPHMPILPIALKVADEYGLMIFLEWGWCFNVNLDFEAFEKNNLREVAEFVESAYNYPSVVMWSMGNEVRHINAPKVARQLDLQVQQVRRLDRQKRPISTFSGAAGWYNYGENRLDTDVHDMHNYTSLYDPWTKMPEIFRRQLEGELRIYGEKEKLSRPLVAWENVGFSWGAWTPEPGFRRGDVKQYAEYMARPTSWAAPNGVGFIGTCPLFKVVAPGFGEWAQTLYGHRIFEYFRLNPGAAGFAPWFGLIPASTLWNQYLYPSLHNRDNLFPRNLFTGEATEWRFTVTNDGPVSHRGVDLELTFFDGAKDHPVGRIAVPELASHSRFTTEYRLELPATLPPGHGQLRLALKKEGRIIGRNFYDLFLAKRSTLEQKITPERPVFLFDTGAPGNVAAGEAILNRYQIPFRRVKSAKEAGNNGLLVVPPELVEEQRIDLTLPEVTDFMRTRGGTLLVLEQKNRRSVFPGGRTLTPDGKTYVDMVTPTHPIFAGLDHRNFDSWNNPDHAFVVTSSFMPWTPDAILAKGPTFSRTNNGGALVEATDGRGRVLLSQLTASTCAPVDSSAALYLRNLLCYAAGKTVWPEALPLVDAEGPAFIVDETAALPINLADYANRSFSDEKNDDGRGGWTDQGENDFRVMPLGSQTAAGVPFEILDPERNQGRSCLVVRGTERPRFPAAIRGIRVGAKLTRLFFLHTAAWGNNNPAGVYRIHYVDGTTDDFEIRGGRNIGDWWALFDLPEARVGIARENAAGQTIGTYVTAWENPKPELEIASFDFLSNEAAHEGEVDWHPAPAPVPVLIAATGEKTAPGHAALLGKRFRAAAGTKEVGSTLSGEVKVKRPSAGNAELSIQFPASSGRNVPAARIVYDNAGLASSYTALSCRIRSTDGGVIQFVLPQKNWKGTWTADLNVKGDGIWRTYRLRFDRDFTTWGQISFDDLRNELFLFYRSKRAPEAERPALSFEVSDIALE